MRKIYAIGIGAGDPEHLTVQAIDRLNRVDVFFVLDKGAEKADLVRLRQEILDRYVTRPYRMVLASDPPRDRTPADYRAAVADWHAARASVYESLISSSLAPDQVGAFLVWGDPSLYDSTIALIEAVLARGNVSFEYEVGRVRGDARRDPDLRPPHAFTRRGDQPDPRGSPRTSRLDHGHLPPPPPGRVTVSPLQSRVMPLQSREMPLPSREFRL